MQPFRDAVQVLNAYLWMAIHVTHALFIGEEGIGLANIVQERCPTCERGSGRVMYHPSSVFVNIVDVILRLLVEAFHGDELGKHYIQDLCVLHERSVDVFAAKKLGQLVFDAFTSDQA